MQYLFLMSVSLRRGKIRWFDAKKGYGFAEDADQTPVFFHFTAIDKSKQSKLFSSGDEVEFETEIFGDQLRAKIIRLVEI